MNIAAVIKISLLGLILISGGNCKKRIGPPASLVPEVWKSDAYEGENIDSLAFWPPRKWLLATAKNSHLILVFDAVSGRLLDKRGGLGIEKGEFQRPNGIAVVDDWLLVVERDNHRIQVFHLPDFTPLGFFGQDILRRPYGIAIYRREQGSYTVYVTDNYDTTSQRIPPDADLDERVKVFRLDVRDSCLDSRHIESFGDTRGDGVLYKVESIAVDGQYGRVLIADEAEGFMSIKVYMLSGEFTGAVFGQGIFKAEPEGIGLYRKESLGCWVTTDQYENRTVFHLFDRQNFRYLGSFTGRETANTDGICTVSERFVNFPTGGVFAVHDDCAVTAFSWDSIAQEVRLTGK